MKKKRKKKKKKNVFTHKRAACTYMLSVSLIMCQNEALKKWHLKSSIKCFKEVKTDNFTGFSLLISPHGLLCQNKWLA